MSIDLQQFCSDDELKPYLAKPFTLGKWTYATDGHIVVRVPALADVPDNINAPDPSIVFSTASSRGNYQPAHFPPLPPYAPVKVECKTCDGSGHEHDCPDCDCECFGCDGEGVITKEPNIYVKIDGAPYALKYALMLASLPNIEVGDQEINSGLPFRFDGGEGVVMPVLWVGDTEYEVTTR